MKKLFTLFVLCMSITTLCFGKQVSVDQALSIAKAAIDDHSGFRSSASDYQMVYTSYSKNTDLRSSRNDVLYYVFNKGDKGYAIVSGDDTFYPLIAYSTEGNWDSENNPPAFLYWMKGVEDRIRKAIAESVQSEETAEAWKAYLSGNLASLKSAQAVTPFLKSKWNQTDPFNQKCPSVNSTKAPTGCVATAMAQIMYYYQWPTKGKGSSSSYYTTTKNIYVSSVNFSQTTYQWSKMTDEYTSQSTTAAKDAVAELMYHCGVSVQMDYKADESSASNFDAATALINYFDYDASMQIYFEDMYSVADWAKIILDEVTAGRPVLYQGESSDGGHSFLCDGYNGSLYHFNWGWGGYKDGYFSLQGMNDYDDENVIYTNIKKNANGSAQANLMVVDEKPLYAKTASDKKSVTVNCGFANLGMGSYSGLVGIGIFNQSGTSLYNYLAGNTTIEPVGGLKYFSNDVTLKIAAFNGTSALPDGKYSVRPFYSPTGSSWYILKAQPGVKSSHEITVAGNVVTAIEAIREINDLQIRYSGEEIKLVGLQGHTKITIYDASGKIVSTHNVVGDLSTINVGNLPHGIYILKTDKGETVKFIRQ
ncbi:MAG: thiol protease/hemagglutinin PrtT [Dysgonamonadaceae bacterium]|jgi:hypothetical protein|nr:thiol protease/hemagglutinin PrtT [Dysgonamonadaceae bacterium]